MSHSLRASGQFLLRPCEQEDLPALERFAAASPVGITTLPNNRAALADRLHRSLHAFASDDASGEEIYLFALEDRLTGQVIGISGIAARAGFSDRFYSFRNEFVVHRSKPLALTTRIHTLHLCHDLTDVSLFISFHIDPAYKQTLAPQLLSRARLLFIQQHAERFSERVAAESAGLADDTGRCPFWDAVGRRFFGMDYPTIERLTGGRSKSFIADLMPPSPVYVPLLPDEAQWAIGQLHPVGELPFSILLDEGFDTDTYIDIFDGGPTAQERLAMLKTVGRARLVNASPAPETTEPADAATPWQLVANTARAQFRATLVQAPLAASGAVSISLAPALFDALLLKPQESVRIAALDLPTIDASVEKGASI
jgi:arginine N-succinyltransferase